MKKNPELTIDCINVGTYLLDFHPHLWTSFANSKTFIIQDFYAKHKERYTELLVSLYFYKIFIDDNKDITNMELIEIERCYAECWEKAKSH